MNTHAVTTVDDDYDEMFYDREDGTTLHHHEQLKYNSNPSCPMCIYCHRTRYYSSGKTICTKAAYLQDDVMHPDRFTATVPHILAWIFAKHTAPWGNVAEFYTADYWERIIANIRSAGRQHAIINEMSLDVLVDTYSTLNPNTSWVNFILFLINDYPTTSHATIFMAVLTSFVDRRIIYYMLLLTLNALSSKTDEAVYMTTVAGFCDCVLFNCSKRWMEKLRFPQTRILNSGVPMVHLTVYYHLLHHVKRAL
jgi:hypothetical protein